jgi:hypothetical protein
MTAKVHPSHWSKMNAIENPPEGDYRDIPETGGLCRISRDGIVISRCKCGLPDGWWILLAIEKSRNARPYLRVSIYFDGDKRPKRCQVSRLILQAWVGPPPGPKYVAAFRDGNNANCHLDNLKWATAREVTEGKICRGTWAHGATAGSARASEEQVEAARKIVMDYEVPVNLLATALGRPNIRVKEWLVKCWDTSKWDGLENPLLSHVE